MSLIDWSVNYVKNKDIIKKDLVDYKVEKDMISFNYKNKKAEFIISEKLDNHNINKELETTIVCLNTKENFDFLIKNWDFFSKYRLLTMIFANPQINDKWIIKPYVHNMITEKPALKSGLNSLFSNVPQV